MEIQEKTNYSENHGSYNCPSKIHFLELCKCPSMQQILFCESLKNKKFIPVFVIKKKWKDECFKSIPDYVIIRDKEPIDDKKRKLYIRGHHPEIARLYHKSLESRKRIFQYFSVYDWNPEESINIRNMINSHISISFCNAILKIGECQNAGIIVIGTKEDTEIIANLFNKKIIANNEITQLRAYSRESLVAIFRTGNNEHSVDLFCFSQIFRDTSPNSYFLVGRSIDGKFTFSFGKREWEFFHEESAEQCALRELYEEYNMQICSKLYNQCKQTGRFVTIPRKECSVLFQINLPKGVVVEYHMESKTILVK